MQTYYEKKRRELGLSQSEVANYLGISYKRYALIGRGKVKMPANLIDKFNELVNKSKGERTIEKLNREEIVNAWWDDVSTKIEHGKYKLNEKMKEFNIDTLKELAQLLGYRNQTQLCAYLNGTHHATFNTKNMVYSFFENELNIQPPKELNIQPPKDRQKNESQRKRQPHFLYSGLTKDDVMALEKWYKDFDMMEWLQTNKKYNTISALSHKIKCSPNTIRAMIRKDKSITPGTLKRIHDFIVKYDTNNKQNNKNIVTENSQVIEYTLTPISEEEVPQEIKNSMQEIVNETNKLEEIKNSMKNNLLNVYEGKIEIINTTLDDIKKDIEELNKEIKAKEQLVTEMNIKRDVYKELVETISNGMIGE